MPRIIALLVAILLLPSCTAPSSQSPQGCGDFDELPKGNLLLFGEMHGSVEAPELIAEIACYLSREHKVAVGLEVPSSEQARIETYLHSHGTKDAERALTESWFWQSGDDGRSSVAMLDLIESVRELKRDGRSVDVFAFDEQAETGLTRDAAIAASIHRFHVAHPDTKIIALMGNIHAMQAPFVVEDATIVTSGYMLRSLDPVSILVTYPKGTIWACMPDCRIHDVAPRNDGPIGFGEAAALGGYTHTYRLGSITASPPAVRSGR